MGKGIIKRNLGAGLYTIEIDFDRTRVKALSDALAIKISRLEQTIAEMKPDYKKETDPEKKENIYRLYLFEKEAYKLKLNGMKKERERLDAIGNHVIDVDAWCADYSLELSGTVGTIEVPGEITYVNIKPGHQSAAWHSTDGRLGDAYFNGPAGTFYNLAILPGWQRWKPKYRYGQIIYIDGLTCSLVLLDVKSSQMELNINPKIKMLIGVPIVYMGLKKNEKKDNNNATVPVFTVGNNVLVQFGGPGWNNPIVIGFVNNPQSISDGGEGGGGGGGGGGNIVTAWFGYVNVGGTDYNFGPASYGFIYPQGGGRTSMEPDGSITVHSPRQPENWHWEETGDSHQYSGWVRNDMTITSWTSDFIPSDGYVYPAAPYYLWDLVQYQPQHFYDLIWQVDEEHGFVGYWAGRYFEDPYGPPAWDDPAGF